MMEDEVDSSYGGNTVELLKVLRGNPYKLTNVFMLLASSYYSGKKRRSSFPIVVVLRTPPCSEIDFFGLEVADDFFFVFPTGDKNRKGRVRVKSRRA